MSTAREGKLLDVRGLTVRFPTSDGVVQAVSDITFSLSRGETLGYAGTTGWSTGCHLHFTVLLDGNPVDPMHYM